MYSKHTWDFASQISCCVSSPHSGSQSRKMKINWDPCSGSMPWSGTVRLPVRRQKTHAERSEGGTQPSFSGMGWEHCSDSIRLQLASWPPLPETAKCQMSLRFNFRLRLRWELTSVPGVPAHDRKARTKTFVDCFSTITMKSPRHTFLSSLFSFWGLQNIDCFPLHFSKK